MAARKPTVTPPESRAATPRRKAPTPSPPDYANALADLKARVLAARTTAARAVNHELILLYWDIGQALADKQQNAGWGDAVVARLASDLRAAFPDMSGFSLPNLWRMKQLVVTHTAADFLSQLVRAMPQGKASAAKLSHAVRELVASVPWGHHAPAEYKGRLPTARQRADAMRDASPPED